MGVPPMPSFRLPRYVPSGVLAGAAVLWIAAGGHWAGMLVAVGLYLIGQAAFAEYPDEGKL